MLIKYPALIPHLQKKMHFFYVLQGNDHYLLNDAAVTIKHAWRQRGETDEKILYINSAADWDVFHNEANSYSLFYDQVLLDIRFEKKAIDAVGKAIIHEYLNDINQQCLVILHATAVPAKQMLWLSHHAHVILVQAAPMTGYALEAWIGQQLKTRSIRYPQEAPALIHQYTHGNMLASAQLIEKIALIADDTRGISLEDVKAQLIDHCEYQLYELADACLSANALKALHLIRLACNNRTEPTLLLWLLTQEIRQLILLSHKVKQNMSFSTACSQQKIWPQRAHLYEKTMARVPLVKLYQLLQLSKQLDEQIKSNQNLQIWNGLEQIALGICL